MTEPTKDSWWRRLTGELDKDVEPDSPAWQQTVHVLPGKCSIYEEPAPQLAQVLRATLAHMWPLLDGSPLLPFPQNAMSVSFKTRRPGRSINGIVVEEEAVIENLPLPVGAAFALWERWPAFRGWCLNCGGATFGYGAVGGLGVGAVLLCCVRCGARVSRRMGGLSELVPSLKGALVGSRFATHTACFGGCIPGPRRPLVDALRQLGATDLPDEAWLGGDDPPAARVEISVAHPERPRGATAGVRQ